MSGMRQELLERHSECRRASDWPPHLWTPWPKPMCRFGTALQAEGMRIGKYRRVVIRREEHHRHDFSQAELPLDLQQDFASVTRPQPSQMAPRLSGTSKTPES